MNSTTNTQRGRDLGAVWLSVSMNLAWTLVWYLAIRSAFHLLPTEPLVERIHRFARIQEPVVVADQIFYSAGLAIVIASVIWALSKLTVTGNSWNILLGVFSVAPFPILALCYPIFLFLPDQIEMYQVWLWGELCAVLVWVVSYALTKHLRSSLNIVIVLLHFAIWIWAAGTWTSLTLVIHLHGVWSFATWASLLYYYGFATFGILATSLWLRYVARLSPPDPAKLGVAPGESPADS